MMPLKEINQNQKMKEMSVLQIHTNPFFEGMLLQ